MEKLKIILKGIKYNIIALKYLIKEEKISSSREKFMKKLWCLLHGFTSSKYELYNFKLNNYKLYLSDFARRKTEKINGKYALIINDKNIFTKIFQNEQLVAQIFGEIKNGNIIINNIVKPFDDFYNLLKANKSLFIKKQSGGGGKGIYKLSLENEVIYLNHEKIDISDCENFIQSLSKHLIVEELTQAEYSQKIYPGTINSIRILTMRDPKTNDVFIPIAVHKFGSDLTKPVDNVWKGGMTSLVDLSTGQLGKPAYHKNNNHEIEWISTHPDTMEHIEGVFIPKWDKVKEIVLGAARSQENLKYVGWDVVVTEKGIKIIEGNNYSEVSILQIHQPLLKDEKVKRFYEFHKII